MLTGRSVLTSRRHAGGFALASTLVRTALPGAPARERIGRLTGARLSTAFCYRPARTRQRVFGYGRARVFVNKYFPPGSPSPNFRENNSETLPKLCAQFFQRLDYHTP